MENFRVLIVRHDDWTTSESSSFESLEAVNEGKTQLGESLVISKSRGKKKSFGKIFMWDENLVYSWILCNIATQEKIEEISLFTLWNISPIYVKPFFVTFLKFPLTHRHGTHISLRLHMRCVRCLPSNSLLILIHF